MGCERGGLIMIKLVCENCAHVWFTSNTSNDQECDDCGERLIEVDFINVVKIKNVPEFTASDVAIKRKKSEKAIPVNC